VDTSNRRAFLPDRDRARQPPGT